MDWKRLGFPGHVLALAGFQGFRLECVACYWLDPTRGRAGKWPSHPILPMKTKSWLIVFAGLIGLGILFWANWGEERQGQKGSSASVGSDGSEKSGPGPAELKAELESEVQAERALLPGQVGPMSEAVGVGLATEKAVLAAEELVQLSGRVIDGAGQPLPRVRVQFLAYKGWGGPGLGVELDTEKHYFGHQQETPDDGRFIFEVSHPGERAWLSIDAGRWWTSQSVSFSSVGTAQRLLKIGPQDLGDIVLLPAGAVEGWVADPSGRPVPKAKVSVRQGERGSVGISDTADEQGHFLMEHVPAGEYTLQASAEDFVTGGDQPVVVVPGAKSPGSRLVIEPGPRLWGRVVDEGGQGVPGLQLTLSPAEGGYMVNFESGPEGAYDLVLRTRCPHWLRLESSGWELISDVEADPDALNGQPLDLRVRAWPMTRFVVRDQSSGQPIERFGLKIYNPDNFNSPALTGALLVESHPEGILSRPARPGVDGLVVLAPGYGMREGGVAWSASGTQECQVWLEPRGALTGRIVGPTGPLADVPWKLDAHNGSHFGLKPLEGKSDAQGRFVIREHCGGPYRLSLNGNNAPNLIRDGIDVPSAQDLDLGDLSLSAPGSLEVEVRMPPGEAQLGVRVIAEGPDGKVDGRTDAAGRIRFDRLSTGAWRLRSPGTERVGDSGMQLVVVASGAATQAVIDLRDRGLCQLDLEFEFPGGRPESPSFILVPPKGAIRVDVALPRQWEFKPRSIDAAGRWSGLVLPSGPTRISFEAIAGQRVTLPEPLLSLTPGAAVRARVRVELGQLDMLLAPTLQWPPQGNLELTLEALDVSGFVWQAHGQVP